LGEKASVVKSLSLTVIPHFILVHEAADRGRRLQVAPPPVVFHVADVVNIATLNVIINRSHAYLLRTRL
jgi:hypothetical protein